MILLETHVWTDAVDYLLSTPGISTISCAWLLVAAQCFELCQTPEEAASFAGLAPHPKQSGTSKNSYRAIEGGGHQTLRNTLYMASAPDSRFNLFSKPSMVVWSHEANRKKSCAVPLLANSFILLGVVLPNIDFLTRIFKLFHKLLDFMIDF